MTLAICRSVVLIMPFIGTIIVQRCGVIVTSGIWHSHALFGIYYGELSLCLTCKAPNTAIAKFANTVDPDETAHYSVCPIDFDRL